MVSALVPGSSGPGSSRGIGHGKGDKGQGTGNKGKGSVPLQEYK